MKADNGGWTVIQRRGKFPVQEDFYRDWESYKNGFGNITQEFWLGNENIRILCHKECEIRFDLQDKNGEKRFATYKSFNLTSYNYRLHIRNYTGNVGDAMNYHNADNFSTKDKGEMEYAKKYQGGWWYGVLHSCNLNGVYQPGEKKELNSTDPVGCGSEKSLAYVEISKKLISDVREIFPTCSKNIVVQYCKPKDCSEILASGRKENGVYTIWPRIPHSTTQKPLKVYCDMKTDNGGWTVIQRRGKFPVQEDFYRDWESYKDGFGNITQEFWLGNENIRILCYEKCEIRFDLQDKNGEKSFATYKSFYLSSYEYLILIQNYTGNAGDAMNYHNADNFSTKDKGEMEYAKKYQGGWWYGVLHRCNLNGVYQPGESNEKTVHWSNWRQNENLASVEIKVRPK
ncbi:Techylectin-5A like protein [Argiope bruennichi]|uniref:Techylectin-5A like protein n=1 Tax=Argiope bruennichi TaxID=94029 RepID=A0A8T0FCB4_ARGBR|nr:Techylectin-5A like protein [Argiope bruennichi]